AYLLDSRGQLVPRGVTGELYIGGVAKEKGGLQDRVDALKTVDVPAITDKDGNGVADTTDTLVADAQAAVNTAEEKQQAAAEAAAKADADGNGLITPAEAKAVEDANKALVDAKQAAQDAVSQVPDEAKEKGGLQDRVDALKTVDVPAITDKDGNGVADTTDTLVADAQAAVNTAEEKQQA
ncbi:GA-like domain-containing protein, partial [Gibbsiella quercinecans]|uniref:GA-like domain-containing protein n=1 Tax=Gibbsiella quercinecans TaxID=929813 RepID=UPI0039B436AB